MAVTWKELVGYLVVLLGSVLLVATIAAASRWVDDGDQSQSPFDSGLWKPAPSSPSAYGRHQRQADLEDHLEVLERRSRESFASERDPLTIRPFFDQNLRFRGFIWDSPDLLGPMIRPFPGGKKNWTQEDQ